MKLSKRRRVVKAYRKAKQKIKNYEDEAAQDKALCFGMAMLCILIMVLWRWINEPSM